MGGDRAVTGGGAGLARTPEGEADVQLAAVSKRYGDVVAVDQVDLVIERGEFVALLGPSGSGKTTMLRLIAGFVQPDGGQIWIRGRLCNRVPPYKRELGMVFQNYGLFPHMTVADNVAYGLKARRVPKSEQARRVTEALALVQLPGYEARFPAQLSGGQQQRVALARAIVINPLALLLDEPLGALDRKLREQMQIELKALQRRLGVTTIFVTHDQEEALTMADRIAVLDHGRIAQVGTPAEIYERPRTRFVADFIGLTNFLTGTVTTVHPDAVVADLAGLVPVTLPPWPGAAVGQRIEAAVRPEKVRVLPRHAAPPPGAIALPGRLEQVVYHGQGTYYHARVSDALVLQAYAPNDGREPHEAVEAADVLVAWERESTRVLEDVGPMDGGAP